MIRAAILSAACAVALFAAAPSEAAPLPPAQMGKWTSAPIPGGAIAQVNAKGEGRFGVICAADVKKGAIVYLPPADARTALDGKAPISVVFNFDSGDEKIGRELTWAKEGFFTGPFGPNSKLAEMMKKKLVLKVNVKNHPGVYSEFTLKDSWASIEKMFSLCR